MTRTYEPIWWVTEDDGEPTIISLTVEEKLKAAKRFIQQHETSPADRTPEEQAIIARTIAVDFDDTLTISLWSPTNPTHEIGPTLESNLAKAKKLVEDGYYLIIYTARGWEDEEAIAQWCKDNDLPVLRVVCGKPIAISYIDDRGCHESEEQWGIRRRLTQL